MVDQLLDSVIANPKSKSHWLVLCDWLTEHNELAGHMLNTEVNYWFYEFNDFGTEDPEFKKLEELNAALLNKHYFLGDGIWHLVFLARNNDKLLQANALKWKNIFNIILNHKE